MKYVVIKMDEEDGELLFISANKEKLVYIREALKKYDVSVSCKEFRLQEVVTDDLFFITALKATEAFAQYGKPCVVLDTGFYIDHYPGYPSFPGALINYHLSRIGGIDGLLDQMKDISNRNCHFKECLVYYDGDNFQTFYGYRYGTLTREKTGEEVSNFTRLWTVFIPVHADKTLAEMSVEERDSSNEFYTDATKLFASWYKDKKVKVLK